MNTRLLLSISAIALGAAGLAGTFAPHEILQSLGIAPIGVLPLLVQLLAALYFAAAMMNWTARGSLIGGIYQRPVAIANLTHFIIGALALLKAAVATRSVPVIIAAAIYGIFALAFANVFFRSPVARNPV
ncbi:MAG TPA: hypothetical protein VF219_19740 [Vicinamibacterales bacterium]